MMMHTKFDTIILLTGSIEAVALAAVLCIRNPRLHIRHVARLAELEALDHAELARSRLIGFATDVIVPPQILDALGFGAYNFHPGPPNYPGWGPAHFAIYDGAATFGVTAHMMVERVDAGPIVDVVIFPIPHGTPAVRLEQMAFTALTRLFSNRAGALTQREPLATLPIAWSGHKSTRRQLHELQNVHELQNAAIAISKKSLGRRVAPFGRGQAGEPPALTPDNDRFRYVASSDKTRAQPRKLVAVKQMAKLA
jgi:hypothetical protein